MTAPTDDIINKVVDLQASFRALDSMGAEERARVSMLLASYFLEYAAYEMAVRLRPEETSDMILLAARLEKSAQKLVNCKLLEKDAQGLRKNLQ